MSTKEEQFWRDLLAHSTPAFAGDAEPPYGFTGRVLAHAREQRRQQDAFDRIGLRAIMASLAVVTGLGILTASLQMNQDVDPGIKTMALTENVQISP